ncbi:hypothetical protein OCU04_008466 [Sclerotinia nivalis]|uniref:Uncharacterized protein n=1 Tax=Sclerotinia nivalis TaxID=352851 RepID=A0A9X0AI68_9HELO|nr:hypothetical protein OCU04_008466 [Sclerotinia nivalis]
MLSSPSSFYTALDAPPSSSAPSMAGSTNEGKHPSENLQYRQSVQISSEIESHVTVYFDVQMYNHALTMLSDILTSGISHSTATSKTACLPIPKYLRIASTLLVHPSSTTRVKNENLVEVASRSITLLRNVLAEVGPKNANLEKAFSFESGSRYTRRSSRDSGSNSDDDDDIKGPVSQNGLWRCAKDFWQIVGWSFNCSVRYPKRWRYWKVLLEYLLDVLDADWYERKVLDDAAFNAKVDQNQGAAELSPGNELLQDSLLVQYLGGSDDNLNGTAVRRIVKAAFADGSVQSLKAYPEIFENETKDIRKTVAQKRKWDDSKNVKEISDDCDDEEEEDLASDTSEGSEKSSQRPSKKGIPTYSSTIGDPDSIRLRQRVITLLSRLSVFLPLKFMPVVDVYGLFAEFTAALPIASFSLLLNISRTSPFPSEVLVSLIQRLCHTYLPKSTPNPSDFEDSTNDLLNQKILETCFLPWCPMTSSVEDNAKYSILVEYLFRLFLTGCEASHTPNLDDAIERGISAREKKCKTDGRRKAGAIKKEEVAKIFLDASSRRLRSLVDWVQECSSQEGY